MTRACLDNNILIWGIRDVATEGQEEMIGRAKALLLDLVEERADIIVPSVVVSEFLTGIPNEQHAGTLKVLNKRFQLPPFDVRCAAVAASLWRSFAERNPSLRSLLNEQFPGTQRAKIKADIQIIATAIARNADVIYTHDGALAMVAEGLIDVRELPPARPTQPELFSSESEL